MIDAKPTLHEPDEFEKLKSVFMAIELWNTRKGV